MYQELSIHFRPEDTMPNKSEPKPFWATPHSTGTSTRSPIVIPLATNSHSDGRGASRSRGRGGSAYHSNWRKQQGQSSKWRSHSPVSTRPVGKLISSISLDTLSGLSAADAEKYSCIKDCKYVASYNWMNREIPTIVVPGMLKGTTSSNTH